MSRVFVINDMNHNFDRASKFGTLVYVTEGKVPIFKVDAMRNMLKQGLEGFTAADYLLVSGPAFLCMAATLVAVDMLSARESMTYPEHIKTLVFDAKEQDYVVRHLPV